MYSNKLKNKREEEEEGEQTYHEEVRAKKSSSFSGKSLS